MALALLGKKIGMTHVFDERGVMIPVTVIQAGPCPIVQIKTAERDGYNAIQIGFGKKKARRVSKPEAGHFARAAVAPVRVLREVRVDDVSGYEVGKSLTVGIFEPGERVDVVGTSKGRGFAGPQKRHGAHRGPETHGSMYHRRPGSMGGSSYPSRVFKGKIGAGHMGAARTTVLNLTVVSRDVERNLLLLKGAVPGHNNGVVLVRKAVRGSQRNKGQKKKAQAA